MVKTSRCPKKKSAGCVHRVRTRLCNFYGKRSRPGKTPTPNVGFGVGPLPSAKNKWHIHNALDAKITAGLIHNGERGFHMNILWLYSSLISQSYRGFTGFGGICGATKLNTSIVPLPQKFRKPVRIREFNVGSNGIFFFPLTLRCC